MDPTLSRSLGADYEAIKNDLEQANDFAGELQRQLALNKNDAAHFKQLAEKTREDLEHMQAGILALRKERHVLANEVMKGRLVEEKCRLVTAERDELSKTVLQLQQRDDEAAAIIHARDAQVADLTMQVMLLKNLLREKMEARGQNSVKTAQIENIERFDP